MVRRYISAAVSVIILLVLAQAAFADTGLARHKKMFVVPAPGSVTIDGKLDDWDLSGQITMYVVSETADMQSAKFALMYDNSNLYVSAEIRDPTPMMNRHDPKVDPAKSWNADSCQFRMSLDPSMPYPVNIGWGVGDKTDPRVVHLTLWDYTDRNEPCLQIQDSMSFKSPHPEWGDEGVVPAPLFQAKYVKMADGRGYTFEYAIPWSTLGAKAPLKSGDLVAGTVQFSWSAPDGLTTAGGSAWVYDLMDFPGFPYQSTSCWGKMIFAAKGRLSRDIVEAGIPPEKPLPLKFSYTLPEDSQITVQLVDKDNVVRRIVVPQGNRSAGKNIEMWDGLDDNGKPMAPGQYTWEGIYHKPITQKFLFSPHNSGTPTYATDDGTGGWGADESNPQDVVAVDGGMILAWSAAEAGWGMIRTDLTGKKLWGAKAGATYLASDGKHIFTAGDAGFDQNVGVRIYDAADSRPLNFGSGLPTLVAPAGGTAAGNAVTGIACGGGTVYVSYRARNVVGLFDSSSGQLTGQWSVPSPGRLAITPDGGLVVISGNSVVSVHGGTTAPFTDTHLDAPTGIAAGQDGTVYVSNIGALQNISVFNSSGHYVRSIGKAGGRPPVGDYDKNGLLATGGIALDGNGHLWAAETLDDPRRISEWDAKTGAFVNEFFGGCDYFGYSYIDPKKPNEIYCHNVLWKIDWAHNTCSPVSTIWRNTTPDMMIPVGESGYICRPIFFTAKNGKQYTYGGGSAFSCVMSVRDGDEYKPFLAAIQIIRGNAYVGTVNPFQITQDPAKYPDGAYLWQDKNGDQTVQADELMPMPANVGTGFFGVVDPDLNIYVANGVAKPVKVLPSGQPIYDFTKVDPTPYSTTHHGVGWLDPDGSGAFTYDIFSGNPATNLLAKWAPGGKMLWGYPNMVEWKSALDRPMQAPGRLWGMTNILGVAGQFTGLSDYFGSYHIFTTDGIYVGMLMRDGRDGKGFGPDITASETLTGQLVKPDGMNRYFLLAGASDARVTEIFGLDTLKRLPGGQMTISDGDIKSVSDAQAAYAAALSHSKSLSIARGRSGLESADSITKTLDSTRSFSVRTAYDADNLYVSYNVTSPSDLINVQPDPTILFKGGNSLDIQLATDSSADPARTLPAPGDIRILVTRQTPAGGAAPATLAVVYRPKIAGFTGAPTVLNSPTGKESFDGIAVAADIKLEYSKTPTGYNALVIIPQSSIGLALKPGQKLKIDVGMLYGNATGNATAARSYWMNNGFSANVTNDVPNEARLEPAQWGSAVAE